VFGWGSPMIAVAPSLVRSLPPEDLDRVLIHEWAHVQRRDDVANVVQIVIRIVAGWHPALWWIDRRLHSEREIACDEIAVAMTGSPKSYAECLLKVSAVPRTPMAMLMAPAVFGSGLRARIVKIVSPRPLLAPLGARGLAAAIVLVLCFVAVVAGGRTLVDATTFVAPAVSNAIETLSIPSRLPVPDARMVADTNTTRPPRRTANRPSMSQRTETVQPLATGQAPASVEPAAPRSAALHQSDESHPPDSPHVADAAPEPSPSAAPVVASAPETPQPQPVADASASSPQTPWGAAAAGGTALGRSSKNAGVATAGFFTRFAKRVAGSF
jgi:hypothetical protein